MAVLDHLIFGAPELEQGIDALEARLGVRAQIAGRHPAFGTHNALLSLGPDTYLEVIAPDPKRETSGPVSLFGLDMLAGPRLVRWVARSTDLEAEVAAATQAGFDLGTVSAGSRTKPDGSLVEWRFTDPYVDPADGTVPFVMNWGSTPSPALSAPRAGTLTHFELRHPHPDRVRAMLTAIGLRVPVGLGEEPGLSATLETSSGTVVLD